MTTRPTRLVRSRDLVKGAIVLHDCAGPGCRIEADTHRANGQGISEFQHELTLLDAETVNGLFTAICMTETGGQAQLGQDEGVITRVYADTMPLRAAD